MQFLSYIGQLLHGNLGYSYKLNQSVAALFKERWPQRLPVRRRAVLSLVIAIPLGIFQAVKRNTVGDYVVTTARSSPTRCRPSSSA